MCVTKLFIQAEPVHTMGLCMLTGEMDLSGPVETGLDIDVAPGVKLKVHSATRGHSDGFVHATVLVTQSHLADIRHLFPGFSAQH